MKNGLLKYILIGIAAFAAFVAGWALIDSLINSEVTFADGFSRISNWLLGAVFGISWAASAWRKDNGKK